MGVRPQDKELIDGRANEKPAEQPPNDTWGRSLLRQYAPYPSFGADIERQLEAKRGLPPRVPGYGGYRTRKPGE